MIITFARDFNRALGRHGLSHDDVLLLREAGLIADSDNLMTEFHLAEQETPEIEILNNGTRGGAVPRKVRLPVLLFTLKLVVNCSA
jgi:hypothetical protein